MTDPRGNLNEEQRRAVEHGDGPLLISAGPGSGKTRVIAHRIALRLAGGEVAPDRLLAITFTNRAATEMKSRVQGLIGGDSVLHIGTFHWACNAILRRYGTEHISRSFRLLSPSEARVVLRDITAHYPAGERGRLPAAVSALKNGATLADATRRYRLDPDILSAVRAAYDGKLRTLNALDLDDLVVQTAGLLARDEAIRERCRSAHDEVLIDEFQDTNPIQQTLIELLTPPLRTVVAVGDANQAIYGWRQADSRSVKRFLDVFPDATVIRLDRSYRSSKRILRVASSLISHNGEHIAGDLRTTNPAGERPICYAADDERDEAEWVACEVESLVGQGIEPGGIAVLYRLNVQSRSIEEAMLRHRIPYHVVGARRFYERPVVRRAIAYLHLSRGDDEASAALIASAVRGIGPRSMERIREQASTCGASLIDVMASPVPGISRTAARGLADVSAAVYVLRGLRSRPLMDLVNASIARVVSELESNAEIEQEAAVEDLGELRSLVVEMGPRATLPDLLDRVSLGTHEVSRNGVSLMTLHAAKGLEFPAVFITGVEEGLLPHRRSIDRDADVEEERRLCYVGMTRAMRRLFLSYAHARLLSGNNSIGHPSRFIGEVTAELMTMRASPKRQARPRLTSAAVGDAVTHPRWRNGVVRNVEGSGRDTLVTVEFETGTRRLQLCHAPLIRRQGGGADVPAS